MAAPRSSWKGFLKLSLVSVPVKAFTAHNTSEEIRLNQLHKDCHNRVRYQKVCPEHGELKSSDIVSGYEYAKDQYVVIDPQELAKLRPESDRSVAIDGFVKPDEIGDIYLAGKTYYLLPDGAPGNKPYTLLHRGMEDGGVVAFAHVVLSGREQLAIVRPLENLLVMDVLTVAKKVRPVTEFADEVPEQDLSKEELKLTQTLIDASTIVDFDYASYEDDYVEKLTELIQMKIDGKEVVQVPDSEQPKILNLMEALKASVAEAQKGSKKMAGSAQESSRKNVAKRMAASSGKQPAARRKQSG